MSQTGLLVDVLRDSNSGERAVTGRIRVHLGNSCLYECKSLERTDRLIAPGRYDLVWSRSPRFSREATQRAGKPVSIFTPEILGVKGRAGLRIHVANYARQLEGCIAPGLSLADIDADGIVDVSGSRAAYSGLVACLLANGIEKGGCAIVIK